MDTVELHGDAKAVDWDLAERECLAALEPARRDGTDGTLAMVFDLRTRTIRPNEASAVFEQRVKNLAEILSEYPRDIASAACNRYVRRGGKFFPSEGEICQIAERMMTGRRAILAKVRRRLMEPQRRDGRTRITPEQAKAISDRYKTFRESLKEPATPDTPKAYREAEMNKAFAQINRVFR